MTSLPGPTAQSTMWRLGLVAALFSQLAASKTKYYDNVAVLNLDSGPVTLWEADLTERCSGSTEALIALFDAQSPESAFELYSAYRYGAQFSVLEYEFAQQLDRAITFTHAKDLAFDLDLLPGDRTSLKMINGLTSPYTDIHTHMRARPVHKVAIVIPCQPQGPVRQSVTDRFGKTYFAEVPFHDFVVDATGLEEVESKRFLSAGIFAKPAFQTRISSNLSPGVSYQARMTTATPSAASPVIGVTFEGCQDAERYLEAEPGPFYRLTVPHWCPKGGPTQFTIYHLPGVECTLRIRPWWMLTAALLVRKNLEKLVWLTAMFLIPAENPTADAVKDACAAVLYCITHLWRGRLVELFFLLAASYSLSRALKLVVQGCLRLMDSQRLPSKNGPSRKALVLGLLLIVMGLFLLRMGAIVPMAISMWILGYRTLLSWEAPRKRASLLLLQLLASAGYIACRVPDIVLAFARKIPVPFELDAQTLMLLAVVNFAGQSAQRSGNHARYDFAKPILQAAFLAVTLHHQRIAHLWTAFVVYCISNATVAALDR